MESVRRTVWYHPQGVWNLPKGLYGIKPTRKYTRKARDAMQMLTHLITYAFGDYMQPLSG